MENASWRRRKTSHLAPACGEVWPRRSARSAPSSMPACSLRTSEFGRRWDAAAREQLGEGAIMKRNRWFVFAACALLTAAVGCRSETGNGNGEKAASTHSALGGAEAGASETCSVSLVAMRIPPHLGTRSAGTWALVPVHLGAIGAQRRVSPAGAKRRVDDQVVGSDRSVPSPFFFRIDVPFSTST